MGPNHFLQSACLNLAVYVSRQQNQILASKNVFFSDFDKQEYEIEEHNGERAFLLWGKIIFSVAQVAKTTKGGQLQRIRQYNDAGIIIDLIIIIIIIKTTKMMIDGDFSFCDRNNYYSLHLSRKKPENKKDNCLN